ncbi:hypothetical protein NDU88_002460 [Pleurodeles waltl]|uniref:Uncharacterized protein n=1 Tax=Pleurodeles waltl TaxID=8319 RepID=A0AAV7VCL2_PLEWA|nr:hypothetical protein NDU88_002460 [Pleurodeles waltl]
MGAVTLLQPASIRGGSAVGTGGCCMLDQEVALAGTGCSGVTRTGHKIIVGPHRNVSSIHWAQLSCVWTWAPWTRRRACLSLLFPPW